MVHTNLEHIFSLQTLPHTRSYKLIQNNVGRNVKKQSNNFS